MQLVLVPGVALWALARFAGLRPPDYGFRRLPERWSVADRLMIFAAAAAALFATFFLATHFAWAFLAEHIRVTPYPAGLELQLRFWLVSGMLAPLVEETFFRALPWRYLTSRFPARTVLWPYVLGTSLLFGVAHWTQGLPGMVAAAFFGIVAACLYARLRNIWPLVFGHAMTNLWMN